MDFNADNLKKVYLEWVKKSDFIDLNDKWVEIKTPFTDFTGSFISIFAKKENDNYIITDYGGIINELDMHNIPITKGRKLYLDKFLVCQGCRINSDNHIYTSFKNIDDFPKYKHQLIQVLINTSDLFMTSRSAKDNLFTFDVVDYLDDKGIAYSSRPYSLPGNSGYVFNFDVNIGKIKNKNIPALHTKIINQLNDNVLKTILLAQKDIVLDRDEKFAAIINDTSFKTSQKKLKLLHNNSIEVINWSMRDSYFGKYAA